MEVTRNIVGKYLAFFVDDADRLLSQQDLDRPELETLQREFTKFVELINNSAKDLDPAFIDKLVDINLNPRKNVRRSKLDGFMRVYSWLNIGRLIFGLAGDQIRKSDIKDTILEFRDRMSQLQYGIAMYKFRKN